MKTIIYAWRFLVRLKSYTIINLVGLSLSLACKGVRTKCSMTGTAKVM